jgi:hypothetical protein
MAHPSDSRSVPELLSRTRLPNGLSYVRTLITHVRLAYWRVRPVSLTQECTCSAFAIGESSKELDVKIVAILHLQSCDMRVISIYAPVNKSSRPVPGDLVEQPLFGIRDTVRAQPRAERSQVIAPHPPGILERRFIKRWRPFVSAVPDRCWP